MRLVRRNQFQVIPDSSTWGEGDMRVAGVGAGVLE